MALVFGVISLMCNAQGKSKPNYELQIPNYEKELANRNGPFVENLGQLGVFGQPGVAAEGILFYSSQPDFVDFVGKERLSFVSAHSADSVGVLYNVNRLDVLFFEDNSGQYKGLEPTPYLQGHAKRHFYTGLTSTGIENVREFNELYFEQLYEGIDMSLTHNRKGLKAFFRMAQGVDPSTVKLEFDGLTALNFSSGNVNIGAYQSTYQFNKPIAYQIDNLGNITFLTANYMLDMNGRIYFSIPTYDPSLEVFVSLKQGNDPIPSKDLGDNLEWSSYLGESGTTTLHDVKSDDAGNVIYAGQTNNTGFILTTGMIPNLAYADGGDGVLVKFDQNLEPQWFTFIGGAMSTGPLAAPFDEPAEDVIMSMAIDLSNNDIGVAGISETTDLPMINPMGVGFSDASNDFATDPYCFDCSDLFFARFDSNGILKYSTYYGNEDSELAMKMIYKNGSFYMVGQRNLNTPLVPETGASNYTDGTGFIMKMDYLNHLVWFNSFNVDRVMAVTTNESNDLIIGGYLDVTKSLPAANPSTNTNFSAHNGKTDGFVAVFNANDVLTHTAYYGGDCRDAITDLITDPVTNKTYGVGLTYSLSTEYCFHNASNDVPIIGNGLPRPINNWGAEHLYFKFSIPQTSTPLNFTLSGYYSGGDQEYEDFSFWNIDWTRPTVAVLADGAFAIAGTTSSDTASSTIPFPECNPTNWYQELNRNMTDTSLAGDAYISIFNSQDSLIYTTYFGHGRKTDGAAQIHYANLNNENRLYFAGNTSTFNEPTTPVNQALYVEVYEPSTSSLYNDYYRDLGPVGGQNTYGFGAWGAFLSMEDLYNVAPCNQGLFTEELNSIFKLYPNPTTHQTTILSEFIMTDIQIYSLEGKLAKTYTLNSTQFTVDLSDLTSGYYNVVVGTSEGRGQSKLIKL